MGNTTNAPPPATSVTMATNFGLAAQKLESWALRVIGILSYSSSRLDGEPYT